MKLIHQRKMLGAAPGQSSAGPRPRLGTSSAERDLGVLVGRRLSTSQQRALTAEGATCNFAINPAQTAAPRR